MDKESFHTLAHLHWGHLWAYLTLQSSTFGLALVLFLDIPDGVCGVQIMLGPLSLNLHWM